MDVTLAGLLAHTRPNGECMDWLGSLRGAGYPQLPNGRQPGSRLAHRRVYELTHGVSLVPAQCVLHTCDRPICINPEHLMLGTQAANMLNMNMKGRHGQSLLTADAVRDIRARYRVANGVSNRRELAAEYNVAPATIKCAVLRRSWRWVA